MPEPRRDVASIESADRDGRAEALLVAGLDLYFAGRYEEAIHVWTRVLFLDRAHARARAYIDRARTALSERQRRADELLHTSSELIERGDTERARDLLHEAAAERGDDAQVAALRVRLERVERAYATAVPVPALLVGDTPATVTRPVRRQWLRLALALAVGLALGIGLAAAFITPGARASIGLATQPNQLPVLGEPPARDVISSSEVALVRARTLYARGRLAEALQALDRVEPQGVDHGAADQMRVEIQRMLLVAGRGVPVSDSREGAVR